MSYERKCNDVNVFQNTFRIEKESKFLLVKLFNNYIEKHHITTFSFVRHPFERLVSAYKDKRNVKGKNLTFLEFVQQVLEERDIFQIFPNDRISFHRLSMHWKPYSEHCHFCQIPYKVVGRTETFAEDVKYIILKNHLKKVLPVEAADKAINKAENKNSQICME